MRTDNDVLLEMSVDYSESVEAYDAIRKKLSCQHSLDSVAAFLAVGNLRWDDRG